MIYIPLKTDISIFFQGTHYILKAGDLLQMDTQNNIVYHVETGFGFDI